MSPWYVMPTGDRARREAALARIEASLSAADCVARLLGGATGTRERQLMAALRSELERAEAALRRLS